MLLSVRERLILLNLSSKAEGTLTTLRLVRDFQQELGFSEAELAVLKFKTTDVGLQWEQVVEPKDIDVGPELKKAVASWFKPMEDTGKLTLELLPIYERFLPEPEPATGPALCP